MSALKSNMAAISMETNRMEKIILIFSLHIFILFIINIQWNEWVEKWAKQFLDQHPTPLISFHAKYKNGTSGWFELYFD